MNKTRPAFTLIELLVVIAVIALLLTILLPSLKKSKSIAKKIICQSNLRQIDLAVALYIQDNKNHYPCAQDPLPSGNWLWMGRGFKHFLKPYLSADINTQNPSVLWCPADQQGQKKYESTSYAYSMAFYHSPEQINQMTAVPNQYSDPVSAVCQKNTALKNPSSKILIGEWTSNHLPVKSADTGWWCPYGARNFLISDSSVAFIQAKDIEPANDGNPNPNVTIDGIKGRDL